MRNSFCKYVASFLLLYTTLFGACDKVFYAQESKAQEATASPQFSQGGPYKEPPNKLAQGVESAQEKSDLVHIAPKVRPRTIISNYANKFAGKSGQPFLQSGQLLYICSDDLKKNFPDSFFYVLRFRVWPIGFDIPAPMKYNNIFVVNSKGNLKLITDAAELKTFYQAEVLAIKNNQSARTATKAWLELSSELNQDGFFKYSVSENKFNVRKEGSTIVTEGTAVIEQRGGDEGFLWVRLKFDEKGCLKSAEEKREIREGMRPICQSSKLLDSDPIVRLMARRDLLILGKRAKPYLDEKRKDASKELQKEIDRIWLEIEKENRK